MVPISTVECLEGPNWPMHQGTGMYHHWGLESENQSRDGVWWLHAIGKWLHLTSFLVPSRLMNGFPRLPTFSILK